jgi:UDP-N-acetylmuramoyl-tripeptide--D-alanyl-D-alanine ligase
MMAALQNFRDMDVANKMVILGDMKELGDVSAEEHKRIVDFIAECDFCDVWLVGSEFAATECYFRKFVNVDEVKAAIENDKPTEMFILIKGSNSTKLYLLPELL